MSSRVQENLCGIHVVQAYVREQAEVAAFARLNEEFSAQSMALAQVRGLIMPVMRAVSTLGDAGRALVRRPAGHRGRLEPRRSGRVHRLPEHPRLADDGARLDALDRAARARRDAAARA